ncbi:hypothetical protein FOCC_FOCC000761 [Frankliniella occidentalis]|nr:hypothetical protein FOCC_FOCC000761 [Frankliniella occidentalis]
MKATSPVKPVLIKTEPEEDTPVASLPRKFTKRRLEYVESQASPEDTYAFVSPLQPRPLSPMKWDDVEAYVDSITRDEAFSNNDSDMQVVVSPMLDAAQGPSRPMPSYDTTGIWEDILLPKCMPVIPAPPVDDMKKFPYAVNKIIYDLNCSGSKTVEVGVCVRNFNDYALLTGERVGGKAATERLQQKTIVGTTGVINQLEDDMSSVLNAPAAVSKEEQWRRYKNLFTHWLRFIDQERKPIPIPLVGASSPTPDADKEEPYEDAHDTVRAQLLRIVPPSFKKAAANVDDYYDLPRTLHYVKLKIVAENGADTAEGDDVAPINNLGHSLWSQLDITANNKLITQSSQTYAYRAYLQNLLSYDRGAKTTHLTAGLYYQDTAGQFNTLGAANEGYVNRKRLTAKSKAHGVRLKDFLKTYFTDDTLANDITVSELNKPFVLLERDDVFTEMGNLYPEIQKLYLGKTSWRTLCENKDLLMKTLLKTAQPGEHFRSTRQTGDSSSGRMGYDDGWHSFAFHDDKYLC